VTLFHKAVEFATARHAGHKRDYTGEPYLGHLLAVAELVKLTGARDAVLAAAVLHDVLEDTDTTADELRAEFGAEVANLVVEVTSVYRSGLGYGDRATRKAMERARLAATSADAHTIKVADILDNTKNVAEVAPDFAKVYLPEKAAMLAVLTKAHPVLLAKATNLKGVNDDR